MRMTKTTMMDSDGDDDDVNDDNDGVDNHGYVEGDGKDDA